GAGAGAGRGGRTEPGRGGGVAPGGEGRRAAARVAARGADLPGADAPRRSEGRCAGRDDGRLDGGRREGDGGRRPSARRAGGGDRPARAARAVGLLPVREREGAAGGADRGGPGDGGAEDPRELGEPDGPGPAGDPQRPDREAGRREGGARSAGEGGDPSDRAGGISSRFAAAPSRWRRPQPGEAAAGGERVGGARGGDLGDLREARDPERRPGARREGLSHELRDVPPAGGEGDEGRARSGR